MFSRLGKMFAKLSQLSQLQLICSPTSCRAASRVESSGEQPESPVAATSSTVPALYVAPRLKNTDAYVQGEDNHDLQIALSALRQGGELHRRRLCSHQPGCLDNKCAKSSPAVWLHSSLQY